MRPIRILTVFLALLIAPIGLAQATPLTLNHQGLLTDNGGVPLTGSFSLSFSLYSAPTGGVALWTEVQTVTATNGLYQATLGNTTPLSSALFSGAQPATHLGITVGTDPEISPRSALSSAPYSLNSASVEGFSSGPGNVNTGQFSIVGGDNNTNISDFSSILGGENNSIDITAFTDTVFDTTGISPLGQTFRSQVPLHGAGTGTILGGHFNSVCGNHSVIVQGYLNVNCAPYSFLGTGFQNQILASYSSLGSGLRNNINASAIASVIAGGAYNTANGVTSVISGGILNVTNNNFRGQTISGGWRNTIDSAYSTIGGGESNISQGAYSTIGGGQRNRTRSEYSTIGGGQDNETGVVAAIGGGRFNKAFGEFTFIGGGIDNVANGFSSAIAGGVGNFASGSNGAIGGGDGNFTGPGENATVPGGFRNVASAPGSFAAGSNAKAKDSCAFVWADCCPIPGTTVDMPYYSSRPNTYNARATNGFYFLTTCDSVFDPATGVGAGVYVPAGGSMWMTGSSRTLKKNITPVDEDDILKRVEEMPVYRWSYKTQGDEVQHIGPMAEDFYETFSIGENNRTIGSLDPAGVSLAATKALIKENNDLKARLERLEKLVGSLIEED